MNSSIKTIIGIIVLVLVIWGIIAAGKKDSNEVASGPIKIGFIAPLTGDAATYGEAIKVGAEVAVEEINANGGVDGRPLEVIYEDGKCNNKDASSAAQKLISIDKVTTIIGMICSGELLSAAPIAENAKVVLLGQGSSPEITNAGDYTFRSFPQDNIVSSAMIDRMEKDVHDTVAIIAENTAYALALEQDFEKQVVGTNIKIVAKENYNSEIKDFRSMLQKIKLTNPKALLIAGQSEINIANIAEQARNLGMNAQFYTAYLTGEKFVKAGSFVENTYVVDAPSLDSSNARVADFLAKAKVRNGGTDVGYQFFTANVYDQVYLLADIFERVGSENSEQIKDALYKTKDFKGLSGDFGFDQNGDVIGIGMRMMQIKNGTLVEVK